MGAALASPRHGAGAAWLDQVTGAATPRRGREVTQALPWACGSSNLNADETHVANNCFVSKQIKTLRSLCIHSTLGASHQPRPTPTVGGLYHDQRH